VFAKKKQNHNLYMVVFHLTLVSYVRSTFCMIVIKPAALQNR